VKVNLPSLKTLDLRSRSGQFFLEVRQQIIADLGGEALLTRAKLELVDRAAGLATRLSAEDALYLSGQPSLGPTDYGVLAGTLNRVLASLGVERIESDARQPENRDARAPILEAC
jgi:hypothetical protein